MQGKFFKNLIKTWILFIAYLQAYSIFIIIEEVKEVDKESDFISFVSPPVDICNVFEEDTNGVYFNRICTDLIVFV